MLRNDGVCFINLGDSYANDGKWGGTTGGKHVTALHGEPIGRKKRQTGLAPKNLMGIPWRVALALQADGWTLRSEIIWHKSNVMPESVRDRCTKAHEQVFMLTKGPCYFFDQNAVREATLPNPRDRLWGTTATTRQNDHAHDTTQGRQQKAPEGYVRMSHPLGRNIRDVWSLPSEPTPFAHFATFPQALVMKCILAGTSAMGCCPQCHAPLVRQVAHEWLAPAMPSGNRDIQSFSTSDTASVGERMRHCTIGWAPGCTCEAGAPVPCTVFDPFSGAGTTVLVARALGRHGVGLDLSAPYLALSRERLGLAALDAWTHGAAPRVTPVDDLPLFAAQEEA